MFPNVSCNEKPITAVRTADLAAGSTWAFQTSAVDDPGVGQAAFGSASVP